MTDARQTILRFARRLGLNSATWACRFGSKFFHSHGGMIVAGPDGTITAVNGGFTEMTGYSHAEVVGQSYGFLRAPQESGTLEQSMAASLQETGRWEGETWNRRKNAEVYPQWEVLTAVRDKAGNVTSYVGMMFDITRIKRHQLRLEASAEEEQCLGEALRLSLESIELDEFLQQVLSRLTGCVRWLESAAKSAIVVADLVDGEPALRLAAHLGFDRSACAGPDGVIGKGPIPNDQGSGSAEPFIDVCRAFGRCASTWCGLSGEHRCVGFPLVIQGQSLGVLVLCQSPDSDFNLEQIRYLQRVADTLGAAVHRHRVEAEIQYRAYHDILTGLPNRHLLHERLEHDLASHRRQQKFGALLVVNLDRFKQLNDALGHRFGDRVMTRVADSVKTLLSTEDTVARLDGDAFAVLLPFLADKLDDAGFEARTVAERVRESIAQPHFFEGRELQVTSSIGIVVFPAQFDSAEGVLHHGETAMYRAKSAGRDTVRFFLPGMQQAAELRLGLENDLRHAINRGEMSMVYQPQIDLSGQLIGVEALLRWRHGKHGAIPSAEFIPIAEESGLILLLGEWALREASRFARDHLGKNVRIAVNLSPRQFHQPDFVDQLLEAIGDSNLEPNRLELELTEGLLISNVEDTIDKMQRLRAAGISFAIDDFGTGYSSLAYLKRLPIDRIKIDRSFVRDLATDVNDRAIAKTVIAMARNLGLEVIAEGVETVRQTELLVEMGCEQFQGFRFGAPMPEPQVMRFWSNSLPINLLSH